MKTEEIIELAMSGEVLKKLDRTGWIMAGVDRNLIESVAEHSFGTALISLLLAKQLQQEGHEVDLGKTLSMAIIHDIAESKTSDVVIDRDSPDSEAQMRNKEQAEYQAMSEMFNSLGIIGASFLTIWDELQKQLTLEARIVGSSDIIDMLMHAVALERAGVSPAILENFFESSKERLQDMGITRAIETYKLLCIEHEKRLNSEI